jgi:hypothetical protein
MVEKGIPSDLVVMIAKLWYNSSLIISNDYGGEKMETNRGLMQGSVLSPIIWNLIYDKTLRRISSLEGIEAYGFADDTLIVSESKELMVAALEVFKRCLKE